MEYVYNIRPIEKYKTNEYHEDIDVDDVESRGRVLVRPSAILQNGKQN